MEKPAFHYINQVTTKIWTSTTAYKPYNNYSNPAQLKYSATSVKKMSLNKLSSFHKNKNKSIFCKIKIFKE
jgi:hypothetical protein